MTMPTKKPLPPEMLPRDENRMVLRGPDREAFLKAVANPPQPTALLIAGFKRHAELTAEDKDRGQTQRRRVRRRSRRNKKG
jgi:hypothetical protein